MAETKEQGTELVGVLLSFDKPGTTQVGATSKAQQIMWNFEEKSIMLYEKRCS